MSHCRSEILVSCLLVFLLVTLAEEEFRAGDNVNGCLITFDNNDMRSWYLDEQVIVDNRVSTQSFAPYLRQSQPPSICGVPSE
jgi:hypothetical protein